MLECVINISEGSPSSALDHIRRAASAVLLDFHCDAHHNRSVVTLAGADADVHAAVEGVARAAVATLDLRAHQGVHPRFGVVDVVPWVDLDAPRQPATPRSIEARDESARWLAETLDVPCFLYGPERSLPDLRRAAWRQVPPDTGPPAPHPSAGSTAVGARGALVAYNVWLGPHDAGVVGTIASAVRSPGLRTLGLVVGSRPQVSCNLVHPYVLGPDVAFDAVAAAAAEAGATVTGAELVGLLPEAVLRAVGPRRWAELDLGPDRTLEARLERPYPG